MTMSRPEIAYDFPRGWVNMQE